MLEQARQLGDGLALGHVAFADGHLTVRLAVPILAGRRQSPVIERQNVSSRHFEDAPEQCQRRGRDDERQVMPESRAIHFRRHQRMRRQRADFRREQPLALARSREIHRLDAHAVADEMQQRTAGIARVVDADGKHSEKLLHARDAPLFVRVEKDLRIRVVGLPGVLAERFQLLPHLRVVVDFPVERQADGARGIRHGLRGQIREVDDRQPPMREHTLAVWRRPQPVAIGPAVRHPISHAGDDVGCSGRPVRMKGSDDAAHDLRSRAETNQRQAEIRAIEEPLQREQWPQRVPVQDQAERRREYRLEGNFPDAARFGLFLER